MFIFDRAHLNILCKWRMMPHRTLRQYNALCTQTLEEIVQYKISGALCGTYEAKFVGAIDIIKSKDWHYC